MKTKEPPSESEEAVKEKLLQLIEEGDATAILSSEFAESLNELIKEEFITLENEKLLLTEKGQQAKLLGLKTTVERNTPIPEKIELRDFPSQQIIRGISNQVFIIILLSLCVFLLALIFLMNT